MHLIDEACAKTGAEHGDSTADADVFAVRGRSGLFNRGVEAIGDEVERGTAFHQERWAGMVREDKNRRVIGRLVAPPAFPGVIGPRPANGSEHIPADNPGADVFEGLRGEIVVETFRAAGLVVYLSEDRGVLEPGVEFQAAAAEGVINVLMRTGTEAVE